MERSTSFLKHFLTCHFGTIQAASYLNLDTFSSCTHSAGNSHLDSASVSNLTLYLASDVCSNNSCIEFWFLNLKYIDLNLLFIEFLQLFFQFVNILSTFTNDNTRTGCTDSDGDEFQCTLNDDA